MHLSSALSANQAMWKIAMMELTWICQNNAKVFWFYPKLKLNVDHSAPEVRSKINRDPPKIIESGGLIGQGRLIRIFIQRELFISKYERLMIFSLFKHRYCKYWNGRPWKLFCPAQFGWLFEEAWSCFTECQLWVNSCPYTRCFKSTIMAKYSNNDSSFFEHINILFSWIFGSDWGYSNFQISPDRKT